MMATEAQLSCRKQVVEDDGIADQTFYDKAKLIKWIQINVPALQSLERYKQRTKKRREIEQFNKQIEEKSAQSRFLHDSVKRQLAEQEEQNSFNPLDEQSPTHMKHVGKSMFIINNRTGGEPAKTASGAAASSLKDKISACIELAEQKPGMRRKLIESMMDLEDELNEIRAEEGFLG